MAGPPILLKYYRRDSAVKLVCVLALAVHGLKWGLTSEYFDTFIFYPVLTAAFGFVLGMYRSPRQAAVEREAERMAPEFLLRMLAPLTLISLGGTTFVLLYDLYADSYAGFEWWPIVMGLLCGLSIGQVVKRSKRE